MRNRLFIILSVLAMAVISGCTAIREDSAGDGPAELRFTASVGSFQVKATDTAFEKGDEIGLFADAPVNARNVRMDWNGTNLVPEQKLFWTPGQERTTFFTAYYPYNPDVTDLWWKFCVNADQSTHELFTASDLMVARTADTSPEGLVNFNFFHRLSKIVIYIENNIEGAEVSEVFLSNVYGKYECYLGSDYFIGSDYFNGNVLGQPGTIKAGKVTTADGNTAWAVIIPPQYGKPNLIVTTTDGRQYTGWPDYDIWFSGGVRYTANAVIDGDSILTDFTAEVTEWTDNNDIAFSGHSGGVSTIQEVIDGPEGEEYTVTGRVTWVTNTTYGNYYIQDETGELYMYGTVNDEGLYPRDAGGWYTDSFGLVPGDIVTVSGPKKVYHDLHELVDVNLLGIEYTPIGVMYSSGSVSGYEGSLEVILRSQDDKLGIRERPDWVDVDYIEQFNETAGGVWYRIILRVDANTGAERWGEVEFVNGTSSAFYSVYQEEGQSSYDGDGDGTFDNPYSASQAVRVASSLGADETTPDYVYVKGIVSRVQEYFGWEYGNATFWISDDGSESNELYVYRTRYFGGRPWESSDDYAGSRNISPGDFVILYTPLTNYRGNTPETVQYKSRLFAIKDDVEYYVNDWIPDIVKLDHTYYSESDWSGKLDASISTSDGDFKFKLPEQLGGDEWMGQNFIVLSGIGAPPAGSECSFSCLLTSESGESTVATVKLSQFGDDTNADKEILYDSNVPFGAQYIARGLSLPSEFSDDMVCILDLGRCKGGDTVTLSNVSWVFHLKY